MTDTKGAITNAIETLRNGRDCMLVGNHTDDDLTRNGQALKKLQALKDAEKKVDEEYKDHKWFKHGDGMSEFYLSDLVIREIEEVKAKLLADACDDGRG